MRSEDTDLDKGDQSDLIHLPLPKMTAGHNFMLFLYHSYYCNITCSNASETVTVMCAVFVMYVHTKNIKIKKNQAQR